jgi:hypothetical protein
MAPERRLRASRRLLRPRRIVPALAVAVVLALGAAGAAPAQQLPRLEWGSGSAVRPPVFYGWSGDGSLVLGGPSSEPPLPNQAGGSPGHITWTVWNQSVAVGHGVVWYDDCEPSCGFGHWHSEPPTRIKAYRVRSGQFTRLRVKQGEGARRHWYVFAYKSPYPPEWQSITG